MSDNLKEAATNNETRKHISNVNKFVSLFNMLLNERAINHDATKMSTPELELFTEVSFSFLVLINCLIKFFYSKIRPENLCKI